MEVDLFTPMETEQHTNVLGDSSQNSHGDSFVKGGTGCVVEEKGSALQG